MWKGDNGEKFTFGRAKLFVNKTEDAWYCKDCDCLIVRTVGRKIII